MNILFVCTGNICRSPAAEYLLRDRLNAATPTASSPITVASAGTSGMSGHGMDERSLGWLDAHGIDGSDFIARRIDRRTLKSADLIIGLEKPHVDACLRLMPRAMSRTFRLHQLAEWSRRGDLSTLDRLPDIRKHLPRVAGDHEDPVRLSSSAAYDRIIDGIAVDIDHLAPLISGEQKRQPPTPSL